jgi:hypothetical protein
MPINTTEPVERIERVFRSSAYPGVAGVLALVLAFGTAPREDSQQGSSTVLSGGETCTVRQIKRDELAAAMRQHGDYDILATTNRGRFSSELLLQLAREARERDPNGSPLYVNSEDWFFAYIATAGVGMMDAPLPARLGFENAQRVLIEYRSDRVIREIKKGSEPLLAVNIRAWWPEEENSESKFSFTDTTSTPKLKVTSHREITYRLLEYEDMIVIDKIDGITGRPLNGLLATLFSVIGEGGLKHSRMAVTEDGLQVARARSKKVFSVSATVTVQPDGKATKGIPEDRPDLEAIEERLKSSLDIEYVPYVWETVDGACEEG